MGHDTDEGDLLDGDPPWDPWTPGEVASRLAGASLRWYVVAGWAIDLFLGRVTRAHGDIEIGIPAGSFPAVREALGDFEFDVVGSGRRWRLDSPAFADHFQTWVRSPATGLYHLDVFRDPHDGETWLCRRDTSIRMPYQELVHIDRNSIPYMSPEIVLLFKAKHNRDKDRADLNLVLPLLKSSQLCWLSEKLEMLHPGHPWLGELQRQLAV